MTEELRIIVCADTHLGFDAPVRPKVERRRRGEDFFANFQRVLDGANDRRAHLLVHGGDLFFRGRVPGAIVDRAYRMLVRFADGGIPIVIVPGNHERSVLPTSLFLSHPNIHVYTQPETKLLDLGGRKIALVGIPCARDGIRLRFRELLSECGWERVVCDVRFLCLHQAIEGATVGPADFAFRWGDDVLPMDQLPPEFDAVLAGHIHRRQILLRRRADGSSMPVVYPGSTERTSFAERGEPKGYFEIILSGGSREEKRLRTEFVPLPARPMEDLLIEDDVTPEDLPGSLRAGFAALDPEAVVRVRCAKAIPPDTRRALTGRLLRETAPATMSVELAADVFGRSGRAEP